MGILRKIVPVFILSIFLYFNMNIGFVSANETTAGDDGLIDSVIEKNYGSFKNDEKNYYHLDSVTEDDAERAKSDSAWSELKESLFGWSDFSGNFMDKFNSMLNSFANLLFKLNMLFSTSIIYMIEFSFDINIVDTIITQISDAIRGVTGISGGTTGSGGLFGGTLIQIVLLIAGIYALYIVIVKRQMINGFQEIGKTILTLAIAILIFTNYESYLIGMNKVSNEISDLIVNGMASDEEQTIKDTLWTMFVDNPYLYLQYGTNDIDKIGYDRINTLLQMQDGEERYEYVLMTEIAQYDNRLLVNTSVVDKLAFTPFYIGMNFLMAVPIGVVALMFIAAQFWYVIIAMLAPFFLFISILPMFFGVLKRYLLELVLPLGVKIALSFLILMIFSLTSVLYGLHSFMFGENNGFMDYIGMGIIQTILYSTLFLLRKRIMNIFYSGSEVIKNLRDSAGEINPIQYLKKGTQVAATTGGAIIGGAYGGAQGAALGANVGASLGNVVTGEAGVKEIANTAAKTVYMGKMTGIIGGNDKDNANKVFKNEDEVQLTNFLNNKGYDEDTIMSTVENFEKSDINVNLDELEEIHSELAEEYKHKELTSDMPSLLLDKVKAKRSLAEREKHRSVLNLANDGKVSMTEQNISSFFNKNGFDTDEQAQKIISQLEMQGLNDVSMDEIELQYSHMEQQYYDKTLTGNFSEKFVDGIKQMRNTKENIEEYATIFNNPTPRLIEQDIKQGELATGDFVNMFFAEKGIPSKYVESVSAQLEKQGVSNVTYDELNNQYTYMKEQFEKGIVKGDFATSFANGVAYQQQSNQRHSEYQEVFVSQDVQSPQANSKPMETQVHVQGPHVNSSPINSQVHVQGSHMNSNPIDSQVHVQGSHVNSSPIETQGQTKGSTTNNNQINSKELPTSKPIESNSTNSVNMLELTPIKQKDNKFNETEIVNENIQTQHVEDVKVITEKDLTNLNK